MVIHKKGPESIHAYQGLGCWALVHAPLCAGMKALFAGKKYVTHREWKYVTCKHCLRRKP